MGNPKVRKKTEGEKRAKTVRPPGPDPGSAGAHFIAWLLKQGCAKAVPLCEKIAAEHGVDIDSLIRSMGQDRICKATSRAGKVIWLRDSVWADNWAMYHDCKLTHHGQPQKRRRND